MSANNNAWTLNGAIAELHRGQLVARVDVSRPDLGLHQIHLNGRELPSQLLAVCRHAGEASHKTDAAWPLPLADAYVRGDDLVASYQPADDWPYSPQFYWNASSLEGVDQLLGSLSLLISVQTHLLDTWPRISVGSQFTCRELLQLIPPAGTTEPLQPDQTIRPSTSACCVLYRPADVPISYVEIMPPTDFRELTVRPAAGGGYRAEWHLFADFLEKGVIRRARLQSAFLPRQNDVQRALECSATMERRPLPLTT